MSQQTLLLQNIKKALIQFLDQLIQTFPHEGDLLAIKILVNDRVPIVDVMDYFINIMLPMEKLIKERNKEIILENKLFRQIDPNNKINSLWLELQEDDRECIWMWVDTFLEYTNRYKKLQQ
jgi:hypothetical protein